MSNANSGIVAAALAALLLAPLAGCGAGDEKPPVEYRLLCKQRQDCMGSIPFQEEYGSINQCADEIDPSNDFVETECETAKNAEYGCRLKNHQCTGGQPELSEQCESAATTRIKSCYDNEYTTAQPEDFTEYCTLLKYCLGDSTFENKHGGLQTCVNNLESAFSDLDSYCERDYSDAVFCEIENFQCSDGENASAQNCEDAYEDIDSDCSL